MGIRGSRRFALTVAVGLVTALGLSGASFASPPDLSWPPIDFPDNSTGFTIEDTWLLESWISVPVPGTQPECSSMDDPDCVKPAGKYGWWIMRLAPPCEVALAWEECIESLALIDGAGEARQLEFTGLAPSKRFASAPQRGLPTGSSMSLYDDPDSADSSIGYAAYLGGQMGGRQGPFHLSDLSIQVIRYQTVPRADSRITGRCLWQTESHCAQRLPFPEDVALRLSVRLHESMTGWLGGRLEEPTIKVTPLKGNLNNVTITAKPVDVPLVSITIPKSQVTPEILKYWERTSYCGDDPCPLGVVGVQSSGPHAIDYLRLYEPFLSDTATRSIPTWSVVNLIDPSENPCLRSTERLIGLVTTNATGYSAKPPAFESGLLSYRVAGLHYLPDGRTFRGSYDLVLRSDNARCLYGFSEAPVRAQIEVTSDGGEEQVATTSLSERDGWLRLSARGFHFSRPKITVKLTSQSPERTIMCKKGNKTREVTGIKPKCPKGWKRVR